MRGRARRTVGGIAMDFSARGASHGMRRPYSLRIVAVMLSALAVAWTTPGSAASNRPNGPDSTLLHTLRAQDSLSHSRIPIGKEPGSHRFGQPATLRHYDDCDENGISDIED